LTATRSFLAIALLFAPGCASDPVSTNPVSSLERPGPPPQVGFPYDLVVPADSDLLRQIDAALDFRLREDFDRVLDAKESGELLEHATLTQLAIDRGIFGADALFVFGDELFEYEFRPGQGLGNNLRHRPGISAGSGGPPNLRRVHEGEFGGPDSHSCATCHFKGGPDGAGTNTQNAFLRGDGNRTLSADERNPPHLLGLGPIQALAFEMTAELRKTRDAAVQEAIQSGRSVTVTLRSKGVEFGVLEVKPDGAVDAGAVTGVDPDLVVRPFGWKGHQATLRGMVEESFRIHLGIVSTYDQRRFREGLAKQTDYGDGSWDDVDRDGVTLEVEEGMLTTVVAYLCQLEAPVIRPPQPEGLVDYFARGQRLFGDVGCDNCHRPILELTSPMLELGPRPALEIRRPGTPTVKTHINVAHDGEQPKIEPKNVLETAFNVHLFSDLRRHDMGPELATPAVQQGIPATVFLTRPLWGLAFTAPYLHDGRAPTVDGAIRLHGGEAASVRDRYLALGKDERAALQIFLLSLTREPELFVP
jgi:hypothetical protein